MLKHFIIINPLGGSLLAYLFIVEDEDAISDLIAMNLSLAGYTYRQIYNGDKLLPILEKENPDLILLDVMLPGTDGFSLMESIRQKEISVIFITANAGAEAILSYG